MWMFLALWMTLASFAAFGMMGIDKRKARAGARRIPEKRLWAMALFGGGPGAYLGMRVFRHKTRHRNFRIGFLLLGLFDIALIIAAAFVPMEKLN